MLNKLRGRWIIVLVTQRNLLPTKNSLPAAQKKTQTISSSVSHHSRVLEKSHIGAKSDFEV